MSEKTNETKQTTEPAAEQGDIMHHIQGMIGDILKNAVEKMHTEEHSKQLGGTHKGAVEKNEETPQMGIAEIKEFVNVMQKFIDNVNVMILQLEGGNTDPGNTDDKFLEGYIATADNVLEIAAFSMKDKLTGLSNRNGFENRLILEWNRATRGKTTLGLVIFGVDNFDERCVSEQCDDMIKSIAETLENSVKRSTDFIARWGEDEFAVLLPITDESGTTIVAERILKEISELGAPCKKDNGCKTLVSIGVCTSNPESADKPVDFINKAHDAYEKAKEASESSIVYS